jgi:hypothetical protein
MAEYHDYVTYGQMMAVVKRLDERISGLAQEDFGQMRTDIRHLTNGLIGLYLFILAVAGLALTFFRTAPPAS